MLTCCDPCYSEAMPSYLSSRSFAKSEGFSSTCGFSYKATRVIHSCGWRFVARIYFPVLRSGFWTAYWGLNYSYSVGVAYSEFCQKVIFKNHDYTYYSKEYIGFKKSLGIYLTENYSPSAIRNRICGVDACYAA